MPVYEFGSGVLWAVPTITLAGVAVTTPTPVPFGALQDVSLDFSFSKKELYGQYQFPLAVARGTGKVTGKAKMARITASAFNLVFGETQNTGEIKGVFGEDATLAASPVAISVTNSATWVTDLGVSFAATGLPLTRVATGSPAPATGQYSCASGIYTFAAADALKAVKISYTYTTALAPGVNFTINNQLIGLQPFFKIVLHQSFQGKVMNVTLNRCEAEKLTFATKLEDFVIPEIDFSAMADDSNILGTISIAEG